MATMSTFPNVIVCTASGLDSISRGNRVGWWAGGDNRFSGPEGPISSRKAGALYAVQGPFGEAEVKSLVDLIRGTVRTQGDRETVTGQAANLAFGCSRPWHV